MAFLFYEEVFFTIFVLTYFKIEAPSVVPKFPNINCLSYGYDIFQGNPLSGGSDPGWKSNIIQFSYLNDEFSSDDKYKIPDSIEV